MATTPTTTPDEGFAEAQRKARARLERGSKRAAKKRTPTTQPNALKAVIDTFKSKTYEGK